MTGEPFPQRHRGLHFDRWAKAVRAEFDRRFRKNTRAQLELLPVAVVDEGALDPFDSRLFGTPLAFDDAPACDWCGGPTSVQLQLRADRLPLLWHPPGKPMLSILACTDPACNRSHAVIDWSGSGRGRVFARYRTVPTELRTSPEFRVLPAFQLAGHVTEALPRSYEECVRWWGLSWVEFQERWILVDGVDDDVLLTWLVKAIGDRTDSCYDSGLVIGGHPCWQCGSDPRCAVQIVPREAVPCDRQKSLVLQIAGPLGLPNCVDSTHPLDWYSRRGVFLFVCPEHGEQTLEFLTG